MIDDKIYKTIIVGAGISGLTIANELLASGYSKEDILILESADRIGGLIRSRTKNGYHSEAGPEGLRGNQKNSYKVFELANQNIVEVSDESKIRYLVHKGKLKKVPSGPISAITSPLIPFFGKLRLFKEPFVKSHDENETIEKFMERRLGKGILPIIDAFVSGIHGGDSTKLSIEHAFTALKEFERDRGSIIRGALASRKRKKEIDKEKGIEKKSKTKPPFLITSETGMIGLVEGLAKNVNIQYSSPVTDILSDGDDYLIKTVNNEYRTPKIILASGVNSVQKINVNGETAPSKTLESYVSIVSLGFDESAFEKPIKGYGFLSPSTENIFIMGGLFTSRLFPDHSPDGKVLLRCFVGGTRNPQNASLPDEELVTNVLSDLNNLVKVSGNPEFIDIWRNDQKGIPQMLMGHEKYLDWKYELERKYNGLHLMGVGWHNISCAGLINEAVELVERFSHENEPLQQIVNS
ncbi:MAG: protoporphyrinogen oxidase [Candidatus Heimdallarchaeota archaeon]|nr:protoporphyrinogen oxidase [Candidatus Heimdallarchaeota archaeon]